MSSDPKPNQKVIENNQLVQNIPPQFKKVDPNSKEPKYYSLPAIP